MIFSIDETFAFAKRLDVIARHALAMYEVDLTEEFAKYTPETRTALLDRIGEYEGIFPELINYP